MPFSPYHLPALVLGTTFTLGGILPLFDATRAIRAFGLPDRIANSQEAQVTMAVYGSRVTAIGITLHLLYRQQMFKAIDIVLVGIGYTAMVDGWICWKEDVKRTAIFRLTTGLAVGVWGWFQMTHQE